MLKYKVGDLIEAAKNGEVDVIAHGCNCMNTMKSGIAPLIVASFPEAGEADQDTVKGDRAKLGGFTIAENQDYTDWVYVYNLYTQYGFWGRNKGIRDLDYNALYNALEAMGKDLKETYNGVPKIGLPMIGAGLASGDWDIIEMMIKKTLVASGHDVTIYTLK